MIVNIVDSRKNNKKFLKVWGVVEPTSNDNMCFDSDQSECDTARVGFIEWTTKEDTLQNVIKWAESFQGENTLYLYCEDPMQCKKYNETA